MSIFYENPLDDNDLLNTTDISEGHYDHDDDEDDHKHKDEDEDKRRHPIPLNVLHQQRHDERKKQEERNEQRKRFVGAISGNNAMKMRPCYEFSSIFYDTIIEI